MLLHGSKSKLYCLANCSLITEQCKVAMLASNLTNNDVLSIDSTVTIFWDLDNEDSAECLIPTALISGNLYPDISHKRENARSCNLNNLTDTNIFKQIIDYACIVLQVNGYYEFDPEMEIVNIYLVCICSGLDLQNEYIFTETRTGFSKN